MVTARRDESEDEIDLQRHRPGRCGKREAAGSVLSGGPGRVLDSGKRVELDVKAGDSVLFAKYAGTEVKLDDGEYLVIREGDLLAIVSNGKK